MYIIDSLVDHVFQYSLSTPWNISTSTYDNIFLSVGAADTSFDSITFKPDGSEMYLPGAENEIMAQYSLSVAWDISTATLQSTYSLPFLDPSSVTFNDDGTKMYVGDAQELIVEYNLGTAWDVTTATYEPKYTISQDSLPAGIAFKTDGTKMYIVGQTNSSVYEYNLEIAFSVVSASYVQSFDISAQETTPTGITFKTDGSEMYIIGSTGDSMYQYSLSTAWDISTAVYQTTKSVSDEDTNPQGLIFKPDGTKLYITGKQNNKVYEYSLTSSPSYQYPWLQIVFDIYPAVIGQLNTSNELAQTITFGDN
jgi:DNA-binding beta-propeller fold protein YncE